MRCFIVVMSLAGWNVYADAGDADTGRQLSQTCAACHGADGNSVNPIWPKLSGQHAAYTVKQLQDFKAGNRKNSQMTAMVVNLSEESMFDLAAYYADQKISIGTTRPELLATGETIYRAGDIAAGLPACMGCHNPTGAGNPAALYPSLSGQHAAYTVSQLKSFKLEQRHNDKNAVMRLIAGRMSNAQMEAVAEYIQGLH